MNRPDYGKCVSRKLEHILCIILDMMQIILVAKLFYVMCGVVCGVVHSLHMVCEWFINEMWVVSMMYNRKYFILDFIYK